MTLPSEAFKIFFIPFSVILLIERILEIKLHKKAAGSVKARWTTRFMILCHLSFFFGNWAELLFFTEKINLFVTAAGFFLFGAGFLIRRWAIMALGELWSIDIEIRQDHRFVTTGPYRLCRHPNYFAIILELVGFCLMANSYVTMVLSLAVYFPVIVSRIRLEEAALSMKFKEAHLPYRAQIPVIVPRVRIEILEHLTHQ
jgi:isoprenylcysteine carboxyl methyltransferase (ICMT) family protein YpbQ